ncbi:hypothetical protein [Paraferrimonas sp. SM1919]|uniref:hypothetical protein n=1 Tax=Paraferrimonas sp. SM1919 TaxID=2662263 RepID=UPI0013D4CA84|nr:hypothetical protein [Paraferrimonas sp. SM1919]
MLKIVNTLLLALLLLGCSGKPSDSEVFEQITASITTPNVYKVVDIERLNGWMEDQQYVVEVNYTIMFTNDIENAAKHMAKQSGFLGGLGAMALKMQFGDFKKGDTRSITHAFHFRQTENGWRLND